jgi:hypothetical protein
MEIFAVYIPYVKKPVNILSAKNAGLLNAIASGT